MNPTDHRLHSPAAERNRGPIGTELQRLLPPQGTALEIASGTGQHAAHFAAVLPGWHWQPSEAEAALRASIAAWCVGLANVAPPLALDVLALQGGGWPGVPAQVDAIFCANLIHISPWVTCGALMRGAAQHLAPVGLLLLYGPYLVDGEPTAAGNMAFDADLRARNPAWGLRRLATVLAEADTCGLRLRERVAMPANNLVLALERRPAAANGDS